MRPRAPYPSAYPVRPELQGQVWLKIEIFLSFLLLRQFYIAQDGLKWYVVEGDLKLLDLSGSIS